jgi:hypothetical protein
MKSTPILTAIQKCNDLLIENNSVEFTSAIKLVINELESLKSSEFDMIFSSYKASTLRQMNDISVMFSEKECKIEEDEMFLINLDALNYTLEYYEEDES